MGVSKKPSEWLRNKQTKNLINEIEVTANSQAPINIVKTGLNKDRGIYASKELVYAYAMWISPSFNLKVIRAYDDLDINKNNEITAGYKNMLDQNIIPFTFENTDVRVVNRNGEAWFVGSDVARALGYSNPQKAIQAHCKAAENCKSPILGELGLESLSPRGLILIPERDVYRLVMRSKLPSAEQFEEKVVSEVLPSIRRAGGYMVSIPNETPEQILSRALLLAKDTMDRQTQKIAELKPKADSYDRIASSDGAMCITNAAKDLQIRPTDLFNYLSINKWIYRRFVGGNWVAYQDKSTQQKDIRMAIQLAKTIEE